MLPFYGELKFLKIQANFIRIQFQLKFIAYT